MNHIEVINDKQEAAKPGCVYLPHHAVGCSRGQKYNEGRRCFRRFV